MADGIEEQIKSSLINGKLSCPTAFKIAGESKVNLQEIGKLVDRLGIMLSGCQLGCFEPKNTSSDNGGGVEINSTLAEEIKASLVNDHLLCPSAFQIAGKLKVAPRKVGDAANKLGVRIASCQLGCFP